MKAVLISIQPRMVEKIASGEKTIEVRKTAPKQVPPFKCYIYCTIPNYKTDWGWQHRPCLYMRDGKLKWIDVAFENITFYEWAHQKVIGEFVCDRVDEWECKNRLEILESFPICRASYMLFVDDLEKTCLTYDDLWDYGNGKPLYGWHISDLKIYDKPKELSEFNRPCSYAGLCFSCDRAKFTSKGDRICQAMIVRPPQSWQYVEELEE